MGVIEEKPYEKDVVHKTEDIPIDVSGERLDVSISCEKWEKGQVGNIRIMAAFGKNEILLMAANDLIIDNNDPKTGSPPTEIRFRYDWDKYFNPETGEVIFNRPDKAWIEFDLTQDVTTAITYDTSKSR